MESHPERVGVEHGAGTHAELVELQDGPAPPMTTLLEMSGGDLTTLRGLFDEPGVQREVWDVLQQLGVLDPSHPQFVSVEAILESLYAEKIDVASAQTPLASTLVVIRLARYRIADPSSADAIGCVTGTPLARHVIRECAFAIDEQHAFTLLEELQTLGVVSADDLHATLAGLEREAHASLVENARIDGGFITLQAGIWTPVEPRELPFPLPNVELLAAAVRLKAFTEGGFGLDGYITAITEQLTPPARDYFERLICLK